MIRTAGQSPLKIISYSLLLWAAINAQAVSQQPSFSDIAQEVQAKLSNGQFSQAESLLSKNEKHFKSLPMFWYLTGYARHAQKKYDQAIPAYQQADSLSAGKAANAIYNLACIYSIQNKPDQAFEKLEAAVKAGFTNFGHLQSDADLANIRSDPRFKKYQPKQLEDRDLFVEPTRIIHQWTGEKAGDQFGWTARRVGDVDQDGVTDFVTTAPTFNSGSGKIYVYSSKTGKPIHAFEGQKGFRLGNSAVGISDINGDSIPDILAGAPQANGKGAVFIYSGKDGASLGSLNGTTTGGQFGYEVSELPDVDGDQIADFLVGEMSGTGAQPKSGKAIVYSGKSLSVIFELKGETSGDGFGNAASAIQTGEGILLAIGAQNAGPGNRGRVYVYRVVDRSPERIFTVEGDQNSVNLGQMFLSFPGDLNQDGTPDLFASDFSDSSSAKGGGKVVVVSGTDGQQLLELTGKVAGEGLGTSPSDAGDVDHDGVGDLVIGAWQNREGAPSGGKVYLYSAAGSGKLLRSWTCRQSGDTLGFDACGIGDVDGDGHVDFLLTSAWSNVKGPKTGRVFIVAGEDFSKHPKQETALPLKAGTVSTLVDNIDGGTGGLNIDDDGFLYCADFGWRLDGKGKGGHQVFKVSPDGNVELFANTLRGASGNTFDTKGNLFQSSIGGNSISRISANGKATVFCKQGLFNPVGLVFNAEGDLFACNCGRNTIQKISPDGTSNVFCSSKLLKCPNGITTDETGMLYVCNFSNGDVIKISATGQATKLATLPGNNNGHLIYHRGHLYVLARKDCRVYRVDMAGRVSVFAGNGKRGKADGKPAECSFSLPNSLVISPDEKWMYVNETSPITGDHRILGPTRIRKIELIKE